MTSIRLNKETEDRLTRLSQITERPKSFYIRKASNIDFEDGYIALERISNPNRQILTTDEVLKELNK
jgi:predicted DNA-binding protein